MPLSPSHPTRPVQRRIYSVRAPFRSVPAPFRNLYLPTGPLRNTGPLHKKLAPGCGIGSDQAVFETRLLRRVGALIRPLRTTGERRARRRVAIPASC